MAVALPEDAVATVRFTDKDKRVALEIEIESR
jgi:hypothetical protein